MISDIPDPLDAETAIEWEYVDTHPDVFLRLGLNTFASFQVLTERELSRLHMLGPKRTTAITEYLYCYNRRFRAEHEIFRDRAEFFYGSLGEVPSLVALNAADSRHGISSTFLFDMGYHKLCNLAAKQPHEVLQEYRNLLINLCGADVKDYYANPNVPTGAETFIEWLWGQGLWA